MFLTVISRVAALTVDPTYPAVVFQLSVMYTQNLESSTALDSVIGENMIDVSLAYYYFKIRRVLQPSSRALGKLSLASV